MEWEKVYGLGLAALSVQQTSDGGYIAAGAVKTVDDSDIWLLKLDSGGNIEWERAYGGAGVDYAVPDGESAVRQISDGGYIVAGYTNSFGLGNKFWVLKLDSNGTVDDCIDDLIKDTKASVSGATFSVVDTAAIVDDPSVSFEDLSVDVDDAVGPVVTQCGPEAIVPYSLQLFENVDTPSDGEVGLNQELRAVASTDDSSVDQITFRWIRPGPEVAREVTVPMATPEDTFAPDEPGNWIVEADFGNGQVVQKTLKIFFFVLPESPIGAIAILASSVAVLGLFVKLRNKSGHGNLSA